MTKKLCTFAGCNAIVEHNDDGTSPRCHKHARKAQTATSKERKKKYTHHYDDSGKSLYGSYRWRKLRNKKAKINPICEHCEKRGVAVPVAEVDHIIELEDGGDMWDIDNLQSLCRPCHEAKTRKAKEDRNKKTDRFGYKK